MSEEYPLDRINPEKIHKGLHRYHIANPDLRTALANAGVVRLGSAASWALLNTWLDILPEYVRVKRNPRTGEVILDIDTTAINQALEEERRNPDRVNRLFYVKLSESPRPKARHYVTFALFEEVLKTLLVMTPGARNINLRLLNLISPPTWTVGVSVGEKSGGVPYVSGSMEISGGEQTSPLTQRQGRGREPEQKLSYMELAKRIKGEAEKR